jgi:putative ABC transport system permease protein
MNTLANASSVEMDAAVFGFIGAVSVLVGVLVGLVPVATAGALSINQVHGEGSRLATSGRASRLFRRGLVVTQVAMSVVLLIAATLLFTSFRHLLSVDGGFTAARVTTATIFPPPSRYEDPAALAALSNRLLNRVRLLPGVQSAGITSNIALSGFASPSTVSTRPPDQTAPEGPVVPSVVSITPGYFETMSTPLVRGRYFSDSDHADALRVAIVDDRLAGRLWPHEDPLGQRLYRGSAGPYTVVGIVQEVRFEGLVPSASIGTAYFPHTQTPPLPRLRWIAVKAATEPAALVRALRQALVEIDPDLPLSDVQTMDERTWRSVVPQRLAMNLASMFGMTALFLSMLGIYGVLAYVVARRTREIGIRIALGSTVRGIFDLVFREGVSLIAAGLLVGLAGAVAVAHTLQGQLFGVRATDPLILGAVASLTGGVALIACVAPAARAARVDPVEVLTEP